jgi:hypothetical protein
MPAVLLLIAIRHLLAASMGGVSGMERVPKLLGVFRLSWLPEWIGGDDKYTIGNR